MNLLIRAKLENYNEFEEWFWSPDGVALRTEFCNESKTVLVPEGAHGFIEILWDVNKEKLEAAKPKIGAAMQRFGLEAERYSFDG